MADKIFIIFWRYNYKKLLEQPESALKQCLHLISLQVLKLICDMQQLELLFNQCYACLQKDLIFIHLGILFMDCLYSVQNITSILMFFLRNSEVKK